MPVFEYKALNKNNVEVQDVLEASNEKDVLQTLKRMGYTPLTLKMRKQKSSGAFSEFLTPKVKVVTVVQFTRQLRTMLSAGIGLLEALNVLEDQAEDKYFNSIITKIRKEVESGNTLSSGMALFPKVFSKLYVNTVRIGEVTGNLDGVLERMEGFLVFDERTKNNIKKALRYPSIVLIGVIGTLFFFSMYVIPKFESLFEMTGTEMPLPTKIVLGFSQFMQSYGVYVIVVAILVIIGLVYYSKTKEGRFQTHKILLQLPIFGPIIQMVELTRFTKTFQTLNKSGIPVVEAFETIIETIDNEVYKKEIVKVLDGLKNGEGIANSMKKSKYFTTMTIQMLSIGEKSGSLDEMLGIVSDFYDEDTENKVSGLTAMIEPIVTIIMAAIVLVLILALFLPMWNAASAVGS